MKPVYQKIHERHKGDCLDASIASLFELNLEDVPHFNDSNDWSGELSKFCEKQGYRIFDLYNKEEANLRNGDSYKKWYDENKDEPNQLLYLSLYEGVNGLFEAAVYSPNYYNENDERPAQHSVIIDKNYNIIHDPEIEYKNIKEYPRTDKLGFNGIISVTVFTKII